MIQSHETMLCVNCKKQQLGVISIRFAIMFCLLAATCEALEDESILLSSSFENIYESSWKFADMDRGIGEDEVEKYFTKYDGIRRNVEDPEIYKNRARRVPSTKTKSSVLNFPSAAQLMNSIARNKRREGSDEAARDEIKGTEADSLDENDETATELEPQSITSSIGSTSTHSPHDRATSNATWKSLTADISFKETYLLPASTSIGDSRQGLLVTSGTSLANALTSVIVTGKTAVATTTEEDDEGDETTAEIDEQEQDRSSSSSALHPKSTTAIIAATEAVTSGAVTGGGATSGNLESASNYGDGTMQPESASPSSDRANTMRFASTKEAVKTSGISTTPAGNSDEEEDGETSAEIDSDTEVRSSSAGILLSSSIATGATASFHASPAASAKPASNTTPAPPMMTSTSEPEPDDTQVESETAVTAAVLLTGPNTSACTVTTSADNVAMSASVPSASIVSVGYSSSLPSTVIKTGFAVGSGTVFAAVGTTSGLAATLSNIEDKTSAEIEGGTGDGSSSASSPIGGDNGTTTLGVDVGPATVSTSSSVFTTLTATRNAITEVPPLTTLTAIGWPAAGVSAAVTVDLVHHVSSTMSRNATSALNISPAMESAISADGTTPPNVLITSGSWQLPSTSSFLGLGTTSAAALAFTGPSSESLPLILTTSLSILEAAVSTPEPSDHPGMSSLETTTQSILDIAAVHSTFSRVSSLAQAPFSTTSAFFGLVGSNFSVMVVQGMESLGPVKVYINAVPLGVPAVTEETEYHFANLRFIIPAFAWSSRRRGSASALTLTVFELPEGANGLPGASCGPGLSLGPIDQVLAVPILVTLPCTGEVVGTVPSPYAFRSTAVGGEWNLEPSPSNESAVADAVWAQVQNMGIQSAFLRTIAVPSNPVSQGNNVPAASTPAVIATLTVGTIAIVSLSSLCIWRFRRRASVERAQSEGKNQGRRRISMFSKRRISESVRAPDEVHIIVDSEEPLMQANSDRPYDRFGIDLTKALLALEQETLLLPSHAQEHDLLAEEHPNIGPPPEFAASWLVEGNMVGWRAEGHPCSPPSPPPAPAWLVDDDPSELIQAFQLPECLENDSFSASTVHGMSASNFTPPKCKMEETEQSCISLRRISQLVVSTTPGFNSRDQSELAIEGGLSSWHPLAVTMSNTPRVRIDQIELVIDGTIGCKEGSAQLQQLNMRSALQSSNSSESAALSSPSTASSSVRADRSQLSTTSLSWQTKSLSDSISLPWC